MIATCSGILTAL